MSSTSGEGAARGAAVAGQPTLWRLMRGHRRASAAVIVVVLLAAALTVLTAVSRSGAVALTDSTSCSGWTAASPVQQTAYARRYVDEHRGTPRGARDARAVTLAIDASCTHAAYLGESDDMSVVAAIRGEY
jgi:hypothetical protein